MPIRVHLALLTLFLALAQNGRGELKWDDTLLLAHATPDESKAIAHFAFINAGAHPIKITGTRTTCGCTAAVAEKRVYAPGERGEVVVSFKTINRNGLYEEPITLKTDEPGGAETVLKLRVLVKDVLALEPALVFWRANEPLIPKSIRVKVTPGFPVQRLDASSPDPNLDVRVVTLKAGDEYNIVVTPKAARVKARLSITPDYPAAQPKAFTAFVRVG